MTDTSSTFEKTSQNPRAWWDDLQLAVVFLTRLPWTLSGEIAPGALNRALRAFPLIGILVGGLGGSVYGIAHLWGLPVFVCGLLAVLCMVMITGALHEDGLADVADGFGGGQDRARKLEIMRDSRLGTYGVLALVFSIALRAGALAGFENVMVGAAAIVGSACLSRAAPVLLIYFMKPARSDGLAATMDKPAKMIVIQAVALGAGLFLLCTPPGAGLLALFISGLALMVLAKLAQRHVGGQTGDVCGASQQVVEMVALLVLAALL